VYDDTPLTKAEQSEMDAALDDAGLEDLEGLLKDLDEGC
jgi:hypothetical protein